MAKIVSERNCFDQILVQPKVAGDRATDLRHLDAVSQPGAKQVAFMVYENLGLVLKPPEGGGMDDAVAIALKLCSPGRRGFRNAPASRGCGVGSVDRQLRHAPRLPREHGAGLRGGILT